MGVFSNYAEAALLDHLLGTSAFAQPTPYVSLHAPLVLNANASAGAGSIDVNANDNEGNPFTPQAGSKIVIGGEEFEVTGVSGAGPYTLTLDGTLASSYSAGDLVGYSGEAAMPTELAYAAYSRQQGSFNAATQANPSTADNSASLDFGDPDVDGAAGSFAIWDASTAGNQLAQDVLNDVVEYQSGVQDPLSFPANSLTLQLD